MSASFPPADVFGEALHTLRMSGVFYCRSEFKAPWALTLPPIDSSLMFHIVTHGRCRIEVEGVEPRWLQSGDLALVPHGRGHQLLSEPGLRGAPLFDLPREIVGERYEVLHLGGDGTAATVICGAVSFDSPAAHRLMALLPGLVCIEAWSAPYADWIQSTVRLIAAEARSTQPGGEALVTRLADILVIQAIRAWIAQDPSAQAGWLGALRDPHLGRAIAAIHREPERAWTLSTLAAEAAMSRSAFAARFTAFVGEPAMRYVARWRMELARATLQSEDVSLGELADRLGYQSEAAFSRAYKRLMGTSPGAVRRRAGASPSVAPTSGHFR